MSSSGTRTALADAAGGRSQLTSVAAAGGRRTVLPVGGNVLESFALAALGRLVVYAALRLIDIGETRRIAAFRRSEAVIAVAACAGVVLFDPLAGIAIAGP